MLHLAGVPVLSQAGLETDLSSVPASARERRVALAVVLLATCAFLAVAPFAALPLLPVPAFIPSYEAALAINDLITAVLLFGQFREHRSTALLALACGYLFDALIMIPHALTFPGLFSPTGLLGAREQTTAWLYIFWHGGFPIFVITYAVLKGRESRARPRRNRFSVALASVAAAIGLIVAMTLLATAGHDSLPRIWAGKFHTPAMLYVVSAIWALCLLALYRLSRERPVSILTLWLMVVMCVWLFDTALSAILNLGRFDLGFYAGRIYGLLAANFVLVVLLLETNGLHGRLAAARVRLADQARELAARVNERTAELARSNEMLSGEIAERRQAEQELLRTRKFLDAIIESIPSMVIVKDAKERKHLLVNRAGEELLGFDRVEALGKTVHDIFPKAEADAIDARDLRVLVSGRPEKEIEYTLTTKKRGVRLMRTKALPVLDEYDQAQFLLVVGEDVTEQRQTESQLRHAQKMEAIGNLTGGMAHDFNNLLGVIIGNLDVLRAMVRDNAAIDDLAAEALDAALRGSDLTRRLLAFARRQPLRPARIDVNNLVDGVSKLLTRTLGEEIAVDLKFADDLWPVVADPAQLEAALTNLATNARDAMPKGGRLTVVTGNRHLDEDYAAQHPEVVPGDFAMIEVSDTGTGMPPEIMAHIFEPFFTTKEQGKGTGLGLSMVFGFMKQSAGHISVYSEPDVGTTFRLYLPRAREADEGEPQLVADAQVPQGRGETVLVVEDNAPLRRIAVRQVRALGYRALEAENAAAALALLESEPADLLFTDLVMPGVLSGIDLARAAVGRWPRIRVLLTSALPAARIGDRLAGAAMARVLTKPYRQGELARALDEAMADQAAVAVFGEG